MLKPSTRRLAPELVLAIAAGLGAGLLAGSDSAHAGFDWHYGPTTPLEYMLAPEYCKPKFGTSWFKGSAYNDWKVPKSEYMKWEKRIGPGLYRHMHHYCNGLLNLNRALNPSWLQRYHFTAGQVFNNAIGDLGYTVNADSLDNPLWLEMRINYARALEGAGQRGDAEELYKQMFARRPDAGTLYVAHAEMQRRAGDDKAALATLEQGEKQAKDKAPVYFNLAKLHYDLGNRAKAEAYTGLAEKAGLDMKRMRERLAGPKTGGPAVGAGTSPAAPPSDK